MDDLAASITTLEPPSGWTFSYAAEVISTQDLARQAAMRDEGTRHVFVTDFQSEGRGRAGRTWSAPPGSSLLMTVLLKEPRLTFPQHLVCVSVALCETLETQLGLAPAIKWPNDLLLGDRKVCGILAESTDSATGYVAIGIGLNVAWSGDRPTGIPEWATALDEHSSAAPNRYQVFHQFIETLDQWLTRSTSRAHQKGLMLAWQHRLWRRGEWVTVILHDRTLVGLLAGTDNDGALLIQLEGGVLQRVIDGELVMPARPLGTR
ncbi:MAG: biotin--[acetyl-CoA-carboxylase] ligase [Chloroflexota bacterium]